MKDERFPGHVAPQFIYRMAQSENLLPYLLGEHCAPVALPTLRDGSGAWEIYDEADIRRMGFTQTARRFRVINDKLTKVGKGKSVQERIDERGKLTKQVLGDSGSLLLAGAGGKHICAAMVPVSDAQDLVIDQTLYWQVVADQDEAWFRIRDAQQPRVDGCNSALQSQRRLWRAPYPRLALPPHAGLRPLERRSYPEFRSSPGR